MTNEDAPLPDLTSNDCACSGRNLDRLVQPAILTALASEDLHGYALLQALGAMPTFGGQAPNSAGIYRSLHQMQARGLVTSDWCTSEVGPSRRLYSLTDEGRRCLARWAETLALYRLAIDQLLDVARENLSTSRQRQEKRVAHEN
jgi:poly-beta-hydroxybutyrate-responsive repressor